MLRRAMLCGTDPLTGLDFSHRRAWIEQRLLLRTQVFTVHVETYSVMSNHYHITVHYTPKDRLELADHDVARRWLTVFPRPNPDLLDDAVAKLLADPERLAVLRDRLGDLSWYMRCLNEPIARRANLEDGCTTGRRATNAPRPARRPHIVAPPGGRLPPAHPRHHPAPVGPRVRLNVRPPAHARACRASVAPSNRRHPPQ